MIRSWAVDLEAQAAEQAERTARLPILAGPLALMPDAHWGLGATVGSVIATEGAVIPAAVGVDLGCGVAAWQLRLDASQLPDDLDRFHSEISRYVPAGVGQGHLSAPDVWGAFVYRAKTEGVPIREWGLEDRAASQLGSLGSGNHFVEVCLDDDDGVWVLIHSGSRGVGNRLASRHIETTKELAEAAGVELEDADLAWLSEGTPEFAAYIASMLWAQDYARVNRELMFDAVCSAFADAGVPVDLPPKTTINRHHNYCVRERHDGREVWVTRKGAIHALAGELGVIPGSMATGSFVVRGLGNPLSYESASHGAGRRMSRGQARRSLSAESLAEAMAGKAWNAGDAGRLVDEHPEAYKDLGEVMAAQADLVEPVHRLTAVLNYKGT